jgi:cephalosporin hydroxylase
MEREAFLAKKVAEDPQYMKTWTDLLAEFEDKFILELRSRWGSVTVLAPGQKAPETSADLNVVVSSLDIGHYIPFATHNTKVAVAMRWSVKGQIAHVQDEESGVTPSLTFASVFQHIKPIGQKLGRAAADFMRAKQR